MVLSLLLFSMFHSLYATWSITAVDRETGEVGSAGASWTPMVWVIQGIAPGKGVIAAQAATNEEARLKGIEMLNKGASAEEILSVITDPEFDFLYAEQQYGVVSLDGNAAVYTGSSCLPWAGALIGDGFSVQGNILYGEAVVQAAFDAYEAALAEGKPLAERLLLALEAGAEQGGDSRSGDLTAMTAYLAVSDRADKPGRPGFAIAVPPQKDRNPVQELRVQYDALQGSLHPARFPAIKTIVLVLIGIPLLASVIAAAILKKKRLIFVIAPCISIVVYFLLIQLAGLANWMLPLFGMYQWIVPLVVFLLAGILTVLISTIRVRFALISGE
ncbi:MAG: DUF1028 domain-containing protein [Spirochaetaceae bacterium]|nr:DUF1028 domain-containing protein [Spirochaetaceae bacterium]